VTVDVALEAIPAVTCLLVGLSEIANCVDPTAADA
jgi:hypothetical protein